MRIAGIKRTLIVTAFLGAWAIGMPVHAADEYAFKGGFPTPETIQRAYDDADLNRAVQAYRFFYPTVSGIAIF